jgi:hypothetical protein
LKRQLGSGPAANRELARDLASLAVSGGTLIIGVVDQQERDPSDPRSALAPMPLAGLVERVEQVALTRCDPPLLVKSGTIEGASDPSQGYLVVHVPPSAIAPHMVEGKYWGRGEYTKRPLNNADVVALHDQRQALTRDAEEPLDSYVKRDPVVEAGHVQELAHLFFVAVPRPGRPGMLHEALDDPNQWQQQLFRILYRHQRDEPTFGAWTPDFSTAGHWSTRADGWAATSHNLKSGRTLEPSAREASVLEIEMSEDGFVRLFCGRGSDSRSDAPEVEYVIDPLVAGLVYRAARLAGDVAGETRYHGDWALGVAMTELRGCVSNLMASNYWDEANQYPDDEYRATVRANTAELVDRPGAVVERLVGRLFRTLGSHPAPQLDIFFGRTSDEA